MVPHPQPPLVIPSHAPVMEAELANISQIRFQGVVRLLENYVPPSPCADYMLQDLSRVLVGATQMPFIVEQCLQITESRLQILPEGIPVLNADEALAVVAYTFDLGLSSEREGRDNLFVMLNDVLRNRVPAQMNVLY